MELKLELGLELGVESGLELGFGVGIGIDPVGADRRLDARLDHHGEDVAPVHVQRHHRAERRAVQFRQVPPPHEGDDVVELLRALGLVLPQPAQPALRERRLRLARPEDLRHNRSRVVHRVVRRAVHRVVHRVVHRTMHDAMHHARPDAKRCVRQSTWSTTSTTIPGQSMAHCDRSLRV